MQKKTVANISLKNLKYLPAFAEFLLGRLREYAENQLRLSREIDLPLLKVLKGKTDEQLIEMSMKSGGELLTYLAQNKADEQIEAAVILWKKNQLPHIDQKDIVAEDINLVNFVRKRNFLHFIKSYTQDVPTIFALTEEIDRFVMKSELESTNTYIDLLRNHIREQSYLNEKITNTSPGIIYLFNLGSNSISFVNETAEEFFGMSREDFVALGNRVLEKLIYHEDIGLVLDLLSDVVREGNKEDWSLELRLKKENNEYLWMRNYVSVFKKDEHGRPVELIGNLINIHSEKETAEQLRRSEERYRQAAQLSQIGHFTLNLHSKDVYFTEELNHIYELDPRKSHHKYEEVIKFRHPDDESVVRNKLEECFRTRQPFNFHFRIVTESKKEKTLHTQGGLVYNRNGDPIELVGTVQDVSERQTLIQQLQESEKLHQQAQSLAHLGNWSLDLATMNYTWSEQMYTIYEMQKQDYFAAKEWEKYIHPEDKKEVLDYFETCLKNKTPYDKIHRIVLKNGTVKVLHRKGEFVLDSNDEPVRLIGTTQDITEQYRVQQELKENQTFIRKIADATPSIITSYNINTGKYVFVSEGLQKLLGYDPAEALRDGVQFFFKLIHPDDISELTTRNNEALQQANEHPERNDLILEFTYRMKHQNGKYRWFHTYGTIFDRNSNGHVEHVLNISLDVTEQVEAS
ncbi:MAG TPA: PAS domain-containing protein, partial [Chitinophagaceae bacterium]|nr:PAS domain-containing protein [Chitinophagaceae bacterium]